MMLNDGPTTNFDDAHLVGRGRLEGRNESCLVLARRVPWTPEQQSWAEAARNQAIAKAEAAESLRSKNTGTTFMATMYKAFDSVLSWLLDIGRETSGYSADSRSRIFAG